MKGPRMPPARNADRRTNKSASRKTKASPRAAQRTLSTAHKKALAEGRSMSAAVDRYLTALNTPKRRGPKVSTARLEQRLAAARTRLQTATGVARAYAAQEVRDLKAKIAKQASVDHVDLTSVEAAFVKIAKSFGDRRGISYGAWRDAGVPAAVLKRAGVARTRGKGTE